MTSQTHIPAEVIDAICENIEQWDPTDAQLANLLAALPKALQDRADARAEAAWEARSALDDAPYRRSMIAAGRGHLLGD